MANENNSDLKKSELSMRTPETKPPQFNIPHESPGNLEPMETMDSFISDIDASEKLKEILTATDLEGFCDTDLSISATLSQTANTLQNINVIKDQLNKMPLDTVEMEFITNKIFPLLNILYQLSVVSYNLAGSANLLSISSIVNPKRSELKDTVHLVYKINDECEDVYDVLKRRINFILENKE